MQTSAHLSQIPLKLPLSFMYSVQWLKMLNSSSRNLHRHLYVVRAYFNVKILYLLLHLLFLRSLLSITSSLLLITLLLVRLCFYECIHTHTQRGSLTHTHCCPQCLSSVQGGQTIDVAQLELLRLNISSSFIPLHVV